MTLRDFFIAVVASFLGSLILWLAIKLSGAVWPRFTQRTWFGQHPVATLCGSAALILLVVGAVTQVGTLHESNPATRPGTVVFESGIFQLGGDPGAEGYAFEENPQRVADIGPFALDVHEVTNGQYAAFVRATGHNPPTHWSGPEPPPGLESHPVVEVTWSDAVAYCAWASGRLPTEDEWERAARWDSTDPSGVGRRWPWGNDWDPSRLNWQGSSGGTMPVGSLPAGNTPDGLQDMAGNVCEWTSSQYWPGQTLRDFPSPPQSAGGTNARTAVRGGCYTSDKPRTTATFRQYASRDPARPEIGFRCAFDES